MLTHRVPPEIWTAKKCAHNKDWADNENLTMSRVPFRLKPFGLTVEINVSTFACLAGFFELRFVVAVDLLLWQFYDSRSVALLSKDLDLATF